MDVDGDARPVGLIPFNARLRRPPTAVTQEEIQKGRRPAAVSPSLAFNYQGGGEAVFRVWEGSDSFR